MSKPSNPLSSQLFNDPFLSDVKIRQISNGQVREFHAHKAILCTASQYFMNAFKGEFKEASAHIIELHDDDADHFEIVLKFIYTRDHDLQAIKRLAVGDTKKRVLIAIGVYSVADKYQVKEMYPGIAKDVTTSLSLLHDGDKSLGVMEAAIEGYYCSNLAVGGFMGDVIAKAVLESWNKINTSNFDDLVRQYPAFGATLALLLKTRGKMDRVRKTCDDCFRKWDMDPPRGLQSWTCPYCGERHSNS